MSDFKIVKLLDGLQINVPTGLTPEGEYSGSTAYVLGDLVSYQGSSYVALGNTTGNLPTDASNWQVVATSAQYFETVSKNLNSWDASFNYLSGQLSAINYTDGASTITKTFNYTGTQLTSIVLSGDTPLGINLTKTLSYTGSDLTSVSYS